MQGEVNEFGDFSKLYLFEKKAQGGAGEIWTLKGHSNYVAKIYHETVDLDDYENKIEAMLASRPDFETHAIDSNLYPECTWPVSSITEKGRFKGYIMPKIDFSASKSLERFLHKKSRAVDGLSNFAGHRFNIAYNLALNVKKIHARDHLIVDLKPKNILVHRNDLYVSILDTDGFKISSHNGHIYPAQQFTPNYIATEYIKKKPQDVSVQQDLFALAVIIFRLINNGLHPFQASMKRSSKTIQQMVEKSYYAYGSDGPGKLIPSKFSEHAYWPEELTLAFDQAFKSRHRPSAQDWQDLLEKFTSPSFGIVSRCNKHEDHLQYNGACAQCLLFEELNEQHGRTTKGSHSKNRDKRLKVPSFNNKMQQRSSRLIKQGSWQSSHQKNTVTRLKRNLINKASIWTLATFFILTSGLDVFLLELSWKNYVEKRLELYPFWSIVYLLVIFWTIYRLWRGAPVRDCPNCGAYAGALKFQNSQKNFIKWKHQTKAGNPDRRYKKNHELFRLTSTWECPYCLSGIVFQHQLAENPTRRTPIENKRVKP